MNIDSKMTVMSVFRKLPVTTVLVWGHFFLYSVNINARAFILVMKSLAPKFLSLSSFSVSSAATFIVLPFSVLTIFFHPLHSMRRNLKRLL